MDMGISETKKKLSKIESKVIQSLIGFNAGYKLITSYDNQNWEDLKELMFNIQSSLGECVKTISKKMLEINKDIEILSQSICINDEKKMLLDGSLKIELTDICHSADKKNNEHRSDNEQNPPKKQKNCLPIYLIEKLDVDNVVISGAPESVVEVESSDSIVTVIDEEESNSLTVEDHLMSHTEKSNIEVEKPLNEHDYSHTGTENHQKVNLSRESYACDICGAVLNKDYLKRHMNTVHKENRTKDFSCNLCEMKFYEEKTLIRHHLLKHTENRTKDYSCDLCYKRFYEMSKLKLHIKKVHSDNKISCDVCGKLFKTSDNLKIHKKTHNTCFECEECHRSMSHASSLVRHYKLVHNTKRTLSQIEEKAKKEVMS